MKILVTGGAGFIGSHTVVELVSAGYEPIIVDNFSNSERKVIGKIEEIIEQKITSYVLDCRNQKALDSVFAEHPDITGVIHFAAYKSVSESVNKPERYYENNLVSLTSLCQSIEKYGVNKFVFSSSCTVYGMPTHVPVDEHHPIGEATNPYAHTKQIAEQILYGICKYNKALNVVLLRYFNPIGAHPSGLIGELPDGPPDNLVPFITQTAAGWRDKLVIFGNDYETPDGTCIRDFIHVQDLARAHVKAIQWEDTAGNIEAFNIGSGRGHSVKEIVDTFEKQTRINVAKEIGQRRAGDIPAIFASVEKAKNILNWEAKMTIDDAVNHAWKWQQSLENKK